MAFAWQALTVRYHFSGNWTALFCTGDQFPQLPHALAFEHVHRFSHSSGYDGQFYHQMAHDPFLARGFFRDFDDPRFRYRRILVPAIAWSIAAGQDRFIDSAYFLVILGCVFLTVFWTSRLGSQFYGVHPAWGTVALLIPAVVVSLDRMTVDVALVALTAGVVYFLAQSRWGAVAALCAAASLVRESGLLLPAGVLVWAAIHRRIRQAALMTISAIPTFAWYLWIAQRLPTHGAELLSPIPFLGLVRRILTPNSYAFGPMVNLLATVLDYAALAGIIVAVFYCAIRVRDFRDRPEGYVAFAFVALVAVVSTPAVWVETYSFTRGFSPLILLVGFDALRRRAPWGALPLVLTAPRVGLQIGSQILDVVRGLGRM